MQARNGDQVLTCETEDGTALLVLADGIGGRPCDWKASDVACETLADTFDERSGTLDERLEAGVEAAHRRVQKETGQCEGMLAALVALAWEPEAEEVSFVGVGDARIYRLPPGRGAPQQLTSDDITAERVEPDLPGAKPYLRRMLTRAVGGPYELDVEVQRAAFAPDAGLVLASDGAYPLSGFGREARRAPLPGRRLPDSPHCCPALPAGATAAGRSGFSRCARRCAGERLQPQRSRVGSHRRGFLHFNPL